MTTYVKFTMDIIISKFFLFLDLQFTFVTYPAQPERYTCALENNFSVEMDEYAPATDVSSLSTDDRRSVVNKETYVDLNNMYMHFDNAAYVE